jgi:sugar/nucleoside kinase (ribokinase family)
MTHPRLDLLAIGNAIVDVIAPADDALIASAGLVKGSMRLIEAQEALALHGAMAAAREICGGSAANTAVGIAALGGRAGFIGLVGPDALGRLFTDDLRASGVNAHVPIGPGGAPTARCLILVSDDGQRSMCTFPGAAHMLAPAHVEPDTVAGAATLYLEGYLWDSPTARAAMEGAIGIARAAGRKVAVTPSDIACVQRCGDRFRALLAAGAADMLFLNEAEAAALAGAPDLDAAVARLAPQVELLVVTLGEQGAIAIAAGERVLVPAAPVQRVVDTTGAGDLFAAGFLFAYARGRPLADCLGLGGRLAAQIIADFGARPRRDLSALGQ